MKKPSFVGLLGCVLLGTVGFAAEPTAAPTQVKSIAEEKLADFEKNPPAVQELLRKALALTERNLGYLYGSADPEKGGMDCSGTIYYLLQEMGISEIPRSAHQQYAWVRQEGDFHAVLSSKETSFEFEDLAPGDLLFWSGTYDVERDPPVTHTMIYLGKAKSDDVPLMVGASEGRTYRGEKQYGVSVFDFRIPSAERTAQTGSRFVGYAAIPGLAKSSEE